MRIFIYCALIFIYTVHCYGQNKPNSSTGNRPLGIGDTIKYSGSPSFCQGSNLTLTANNAPNNATFQWQKDGSNINGATLVNYTASSAGNYVVIVTSGGVPTTYPSLTVSENPKPIPDFTFNNNNACSGTTINFTPNVTSGSAPFSYSWDFGDGTAVSTLQNPSHVYTSLGCNTSTYTIKLTVTDANGCSNTVTHSITVVQKPDVQINDIDHPFTPFSNCSNSPTPQNPNFTIKVDNISPNASCISSYSIDWGDGSSQANVSFPLSHTYTQLGAFNLVVTAKGTNGCSNSRTYIVANQTNPAGSLGTLGSTTGLCAPAQIPFTITNWQLNSPGTKYILDFGDGSSITLTHPLNPAYTTDTVFHTYTKSSCPSATFTATLQVVNACATTPYSAGNIQISVKPSADFTQPVAACVGKSVCFTNTTASGSYGAGCSNTTIYSWDFGDGSTSSSASPCHTYNAPGTYSVTLTASNPCGASSVTRQICVTPAAIASFDVDKTSGCAPFTINATNTSNTLNSCATPTYSWSVSATSVCGTTSWNFTNGTNANSVNPSFIFNSAGTYTITLSVTNPCGTVTTTKTITVKEKPTVSITVPAGVCQNGSITPTASVSGCNASTVSYQWTFTGGTPSSSTSLNPGSIVYSASGNYSVSLTVTNECGTTTVTKPINVTVAPDVTTPQNQTFCAGRIVPSFTFTSSVAGTSYSWTNSNTAIGLAGSGTGSIPSFTATNSGANPITATITVTPSTGCPGQPQSFTITVNPTAVAPVVSSPIVYCLNETASQLTATTVSGNTVLWYNNSSLTGGTTTAPTPITSSAGTTIYYVTQTNSFGCASSPSSITVTVNPKISGNIIGSDQTICTNTSPSTLTGQLTLSGGNNSFAYQWQQSTDGGQTWNNVLGATIATYAPGSLSSNIQYRRVVNSSVCSDTSNVVSITVQGTLSNIDITASQTICAGSTPLLLTGQTPTGGSGAFAFQWERSLNGTSWITINGETGSDYQPPPLTATTYYRRFTKSGPCSGYSSSVVISVNPIPVINTVSDKTYCDGSLVSGINFTSSPATGVTYAWTNDNTQIGLAASGSGSIPSFTTNNSNNPKEPVVANISVIPTYTNGGKSCPGNAASFKIIVLPTITISAINNETICTGVTLPSFTPVNDANNYPGSSVTYSWTVAGSGTNLSTGSGPSIPSVKGVNNGTTDLITTITVTPKYNYGSLSCDGTPLSYTVTVKPGTPPANAGPDVVLCAANTYIMKANQPSSVTGVWTQLAGIATITNTSSPTTTITGLAAGNSYKFEWSLSGFASCPDTKDTVIITVHPDVANTITTTTQKTCSGGQITVNGDLPTGGNGTYSYQWQQSTDNTTWTNIPNATSVSLTFIPTQTVYVKRIVTSSPCGNESLSAQIIVQPGISNNRISADQSICINTLASTITGALPNGGDGVYSYQWEQSTDGGASWTPIPSATLQDYSPGVLTITTKYRRLVNTNLCTGPQASKSNVVTVTVNPNAKAVFNPTTAVGCIPFKITPAIINLQTFPSQNSQYLWYVNNVLIGTGTTFPGYTMNTDNDTITIKLVTKSAFGCLSDSVSHDFYTYETPQPSFTVSKTTGCGPLTIQITNTTPNINSFTYQWDFGNGQTSSLAQPGQVLFQPNPNHNDTTYLIKLSVASSCNTINANQSVTVKSKPKALFTPDKSVGCSPMIVTFNNTSLGIGNSYVWDFGDGSPQVNASNLNSVNHTFTSGVQDTFYVKLVAMNECGNDTLKYAIVVSPNKIHLDFAINGNQFSGCSPHAVQFINNSSGATLFNWNFGDNNKTNTTKNVDTVSHTYEFSGTYIVTLKATNGCSDTTTTETIVVYAKPSAKFVAIPLKACIGDSIQFSNQSSGATSYLWKLGDGNSSTLTNPVYKYSTPGSYTVDLIASSFNAPNTVCSDTISQPIQIVSSMPGMFSMSDSIGNCAPFTVTFNNLNAPSTTANWDFGDGTTGSGDMVTHTYTTAGTYQVTLNVIVPGGCNYITKRTVKLLGPSGSWSHTIGYLCNNAAAYFQVIANNADSLIYQFGDGTVLTTTSNTVSHVYTNGGTYLPSVILKNKAGCLVPLTGIDTIRVDKIKAGFSNLTKQYCGYTTVDFIDTTHAFFGTSKLQWLFGDGTTANGNTSTHTYNTTGSYSVKLIITGKSGCSDTVTKSLNIIVYSKPVTSIIADPVACERYPVLFSSNTQSADAINITQWSISNGVKNNNQSFSYSFNQAGSYTTQLIVGTVNGCYDTATSTIKINPTPNVTASSDVNICRGSNTSISATGTGVNTWSWWPSAGLSCTSCTNAIASPLITTPYVIEGKNTYGCSAYDTVVVTVVQPLHLNAKTADSICIGQSTNLLVSGASSYSWSPSIGLNSTSVSNPTASPVVTTTYRVVGYDGFNCFTDTAYVTVAVGQYPTVNLGPDLTLAAGTLQPLATTVQNGPIRKWSWTPSTDLSCNNCALPIATIKKNISYIVKVTTAYGCSATDTINIKVFCESTQTFIPNAFTPDGDGVNDILMVRGKGIVMVKSFRIFNRWGELVFEKSDFAANDPAYGWNGKINGVIGGPDVYVYTAEVMCENGSTFTYKGNVSLLK